MRLMQEDLLKTISSSAPGALVETLVFIGPHAPSWKKGLRTIKGARGPRDTYG
jgi:predicted nucleic acid-binding Zn ribbon protein